MPTILECIENNDYLLLKEKLKNISKEKLNVKDNNGYTAVMYAASYGHDKCLKMLIDAGCNLNLKDDGDYTAAMFTALLGHVICLQLLIDAGCDLNLKNYSGNTVLHFICQKNLINLLIYLLN